MRLYERLRRRGDAPEHVPAASNELEVRPVWGGRWEPAGRNHPNDYLTAHAVVNGTEVVARAVRVTQEADGTLVAADPDYAHVLEAACTLCHCRDPQTTDIRLVTGFLPHVNRYVVVLGPRTCR